MLLRRTFLAGLFSAFAAPAIVRASSLMPISPLLVPERQLIVERTRVLGPPRCFVCFDAWGMCSHTGGPMKLDPGNDEMDPRLVETLQLDAWRQDNQKKNHASITNIWRPPNDL